MEKLARQNQSAQNSDKKGKASTHVWIDNDFITRDNLLDNNYYSRSIMDDDIFSSFNLQKSAGDGETDPVVYPKPRHGVTNKKLNLTTEKGKVINIQSGIEVQVLGETGDLFNIQIGNKKGTIPKSDVSIIPDKLEEISEDQRNKIRIDTQNKFTIYPILTTEYSPDFDPNFIVNYNNIPAPLHLTFKYALKELMVYKDAFDKQNSTLSEEFRSLTIKIHFKDFPQKPFKDEYLKYNNNTFTYRITRLENIDKREIFFIEELGQLKDEKAETKANSDLKFYKYGFFFHEATEEEIKNYDEIIENAIASKYIATEAIQELYTRAYSKISDEEKKLVIDAVEKIPDSALETIKGIEFNKKPFWINNGLVDYSAAAFYSPNLHTVSLTSDITEDASLIFGDNAKTGFSSKGSFVLLHELGHAVDYVPFRAQHVPRNEYVKKELSEGNKNIDAAEQTYFNSKKELMDKYKLLGLTFSKIVKDEEGRIVSHEYNGSETLKKKYKKEIEVLSKVYNSALTEYKNITSTSETLTKNASESRTLSGYGKSLNNNTWGDQEDFTAFDEAVQKDKPLLTLYSKSSDKETFAESFALYITEPETLKILSPNVYAYFKLKYP